MVKKLVVVMAVFGILALSSIACGGTDATPTPVVVVEELPIHEKKAGLAGAWIIIQEGETGNRLALFIGLDEQLCTLKNGEEIHIDERLNLYLRQRTADGWTTIKQFSAENGDYIKVTVTEGTVTGFSYH